MSQPEMSNPQVQDQKRKRINELLRMGRMVKATIATDGWTKVGFPLLQKMIRDITGKCVAGEWYPGIINSQEAKIEYYLGYAQALMDFSNRFNAYVKNMKLADSTLKAMDEDERVEYKVPMVEEGSY